jgi:hypothetical protein
MVETGFWSDQRRHFNEQQISELRGEEDSIQTSFELLLPFISNRMSSLLLSCVVCLVPQENQTLSASRPSSAVWG